MTTGLIHQVVNPRPMDRRHGKELLESQPAELDHPGRGPVGVHLVHHHQHRLGRPTKLHRHFLIQWHDPFLDIHHQQDHRRRLQREIHLIQHRRHDHVGGLLTSHQPDPARIDQGEGPSMPLHLRRHTVSGHAGLIMDDRNAPAGDAIEQCGFADIGPADDGDDA